MNVVDRVEAAKHTLTGSGLGKAVSKATSHEIIGPKKKHVHYIQQALELDNVSIPDTADMLFERCNNSSWVVVFKALVTFHHLMSDANERFIQYVASRSTTWMLQTFLDKGGVQGYDMSHAIRRYSAYLSEKAYVYRSMGFDFCRIARGKEKGVLRNMDTQKLLKALPGIQTQLDALIATEMSSNDLTNGVATAAFMALFKDLIRLFACYNDGIINLLEKYFEMKKNDCKSALEIYKRFLARMERVSEFLKAAEDAGINKGDIPDLTKAPNSLLEALEQHYQSLEKGKVVSPPTNPINIAAFTSFESQSGNDSFDSAPVQGDYVKEQQRILEMFENKKKEEATRWQQQEAIAITKPPPQTQQASHQIMYSTPSNDVKPKPSDDLLQLTSNNVFETVPAAPTSYANSQYPYSYNQTSSLNGFNPVFDNNQSYSTPNLMDDMLTPERQTATVVQHPSQDRLTGDLNKGLERIALSLDGLNVNRGTLKVNTPKGHQWTPQQPTVKTGGANFQMSSIARSTLPPMSGYNMITNTPVNAPNYQSMRTPGFASNMQPAMQPYRMQQNTMYGYPNMSTQPVMYPMPSYSQQQLPVQDPFK